MKITRRQVIKALRTEPLQAGTFIYMEGLAWEDKKTKIAQDPECKVCAVGAVFRSIFKDSTVNRIDLLCDINTGDTVMPVSAGGLAIKWQIENLLLRHDYFAALSVFYEHTVAVKSYKTKRDVSLVEATPELREELVDFVKKNFPLELDIKT